MKVSEKMLMIMPDLLVLTTWDNATQIEPIVICVVLA